VSCGKEKEALKELSNRDNNNQKEEMGVGCHGAMREAGIAHNEEMEGHYPNKRCLTVLSEIKGEGGLKTWVGRICVGRICVGRICVGRICVGRICVGMEEHIPMLVLIIIYKIKPLSKVTSFELNNRSVVFHSIKRGEGLST
jgi:hypothetical protein